ncbi:hypothetical protein tb265_04010 [Gemmatimonadetes bacterium T265]|nr:hypothetical protein tb265_04010 [Gemmatimonadetes bacterium T265]
MGHPSAEPMTLSTSATELASVRQTIHVPVDPARAFDLFTTHLRDWWDSLLSVNPMRAPIADVVLEPRVGGRWYERGTDGSTCDWARVVGRYDLLRAVAPSLVVDVNRALAVAMHGGAPAGLDELDAIPEREVLARYPYALAAYADLHASLGNLAEARAYLDRALAHQGAPAQQALLRRKRAPPG